MCVLFDYKEAKQQIESRISTSGTRMFFQIQMDHCVPLCLDMPLQSANKEVKKAMGEKCGSMKGGSYINIRSTLSLALTLPFKHPFESGMSSKLLNLTCQNVMCFKNFVAHPQPRKILNTNFITRNFLRMRMSQFTVYCYAVETMLFQQMLPTLPDCLHEC